MLQLFLKLKNPAKVSTPLIQGWYDYFFLVQAALCFFLICWINHVRQFTIQGCVFALAAPFSILLLVAAFLYRNRGFLLPEKEDTLFPDKFLTALVLCLLILTIVMIRSIQVILIPSYKAQMWYGKEKQVTGTVVSYVSGNSGSSRFLNPWLSSADAFVEEEKQKGASVLFRTEIGLVSVYCMTEGLEIGDRIKADLQFSEPSPPRNPGGFDERGYYESISVYLKGKLADQASLSVTGETADFILKAASAARSAVIRVFDTNIPAREAGLMAGLLIGDRSGMSGEDIKVYQMAGLSHITAVSGSAIAFLLVPIRFLLKKFKISKRKKSIITVSILLFFGFMTGWTSSVARAMLMVFVMMASRMCHQKIRAIQSLFITMTFLMVFSPAFALNIGFWFSGIATAGIVLLSESFGDMLEYKGSLPTVVKSTLASSLAAGLSVMPLAIWTAKEISLSSILSNIIVLPLVEFATIFGSVECMAGIANPNYFLTRILAVPLAGLLYSINRIAVFISGIGILHIKLAGISFYCVIAAGMLVIFLFMKGRKSRRICLLLALCVMTTGLLHCGIRRMQQPDVQIVFADVGQGDATLVLLKSGQSILIDSGGKKNGVKVIRQMLDFYAIPYPDLYIATHTHEDHCGAMIDIMEERGGKTLFVPFGTIRRIKGSMSGEQTSENSILPDYSPKTGESDYAQDLAAMAEEKGIMIKEAGAGDVIVLDDRSSITLYNPSKDGEAEGNASSLVLKITYAGQDVLITGDADGETEQKLVNSGVDIASNIFRISHHGSPYSTNHDIISAVSPKVSIISVGTNFYGHPSPKVIERLEAADSIVYRTDTNGAILIEMDEDGTAIKTMLP